MDDQPTLLDVPPSEVRRDEPASAPSIHPSAAEWFRAGKTTPYRHAYDVLRGLHPFGRPLSLWPGARCGNCTHAVARRGRSEKTFHKCLLDRSHWTMGPASDLRLKWRGCHRWAPGVVKRFDVFGREVITPTGAWLDVRRDLLDSVDVTRSRPGEAPNTCESVALLIRGVEPRVMGVLCDAEEAARTLDHARVALDRWLDVVAGGMGPGPAAALLLEAVKRGVEQIRVEMAGVTDATRRFTATSAAARL